MTATRSARSGVNDTNVAIGCMASRFFESGDLDAAILESLADIGKICGASRAALLQVDLVTGLLSCTHEWCSRGVRPVRAALQGLNPAVIPFWQTHVSLGQRVFAEEMSVCRPGEDGWPAEATKAGFACSEPLRIAGAVRGMVCLGCSSASGKVCGGEASVPRLFAGLLGSILTRREAEQALVANQMRYSNLFRDSSDAIIIHTLDGRLVEVNRMAVQLFGYSQEEFLDLTVGDLHPDSELPRSRGAFSRVCENGTVRFEIKFRRRNGEEFDAEVSSSIFQSDQGPLVQG
ncbi:MAG: PAS domain S-box protein, partial [Lentisphaerae bacterium]|nr:PAS domain S-box protein [Lentisphaerota bacterium]